MLFSFTIDFGQILLVAIGLLLSIVGWFTKKEITAFGKRIDKHDDALLKLTGQVQRLIGYYEATKNHMREEL
jgi:hypothetical protein